MKRLMLALWLCAVSLSAHANSTDCATDAPSPETIATTMHQAQQLKQALNSQPEAVVVLVRQGQDMSSRNLTWSHAGYAMRQPDDSWRVYHNLNTCGSAESSLYVQGLYEFLADIWSTRRLRFCARERNLSRRYRLFCTAQPSSICSIVRATI
ncbi:hypothetical protein SB6408_02326 [Klebsiella spallanzanii]|uniref:DUF2145 domain-containing protein n=1 Tax=Klebsiella spallanzanii TaxID=2587528 RepID=A0A564NIB7_9ENTR|nr:hypothetical protein SB6408_02326 [Klebsiella spallanzanii]